jgi:hypothetical protein
VGVKMEPHPVFGRTPLRRSCVRFGHYARQLFGVFPLFAP